MNKSKKILILILVALVIIVLTIIQIINYNSNITTIKSPEGKTGAEIVQGLKMDYEESKTSDSSNENISADIESDEYENDFGAKYALEKDDFTVEEMLKYAIEDEFLARQEYECIMEEYGEQKPFSNIILAEVNHIEMIKEIYDSYEYDMPKDTAIDHVIIPESISDALEIGVQAEIDNIAMYNKFLEYDLPEDIKDVFIKLRDASEKHLKAFENGVDRGN